jgi:hypothetical protein
MDFDAGDKRILISANECDLFYRYLEKAQNKDETVNIDYEESENLPYQIIYGGLMFDIEKENLKDIVELTSKMKNVAFLTLEEHKASVSAYADIVLYLSEALSENFIPFAALMKTPYRLENMDHSVTMFSALEGHYVWESMANRPFLLACRKSILVHGLSIENWKQHISFNEMIDAYKVADLFIDSDELLE